MSLTVIGFSALSGIPLFNRHEGPKPEKDSFTFEKMALLNTINHYSRLNYSNLMSTRTNDSQIHWKLFKGTIFLILTVNGGKNTNFEIINESNVEIILNIIFSSMVFSCGLNNLLVTLEKNIEMFKNNIRASFPYIDHILHQLYTGKCLNIILDCNEYLISDHTTTSYLENLIENYTKVASSQYGCILINNKIITASKGWWTRISTTQDSPIIINAINSIKMIENQAKVLKVYLPTNCPDSVTRLFIFSISKNVSLALLCSENFSIKQLEDAILPLNESKENQDFFQRTQVDNLLHFKLDETLMNIIIVKENKKIFSKYGFIDDSKLKSIVKLLSFHSKSTPTKSFESFVNFGNYKGYICERNSLMLILLYPIGTSYNDMKKIASTTLAMVSKEKKLLP